MTARRPGAWVLMGWAVAIVAPAPIRAAIPGAPPPDPVEGPTLSLAERQNNLGAELAAQGQFKQAAVAFRKAIDLDPLFPTAHFNLGLAHSRLGDRKEAARSFEDATRVAPDYRDAWFHLGASREALDDLPGAAEAFERAAAIPVLNAAVGRMETDPTTRFRLGAVYWRMGRWGEVVRIWQGLLSESPGHGSVPRVREELPRACYNHGVTLQEAGRADSAAAAYKEALRLRPDYAEARQNLGILLREEGRLAESLQVLQKAVEQHPEALGSLSALAATFAAMDSLDAAARTYARIPDDDADGHLGLAMVRLRQGDVAGATKAAQRAVSVAPANAAAHGFLAYVFEFNAEGKHYGPGYPARVAIGAYQKALELDPGNVAYHFNLGAIHGRQSEWEPCIVHLRRAIELNPEHAEARKWLAVAEEKAGRK